MIEVGRSPVQFRDRPAGKPTTGDLKFPVPITRTRLQNAFGIHVSRKPLLIIFITVFIDLLGFAIVLPLLPRYADHFLSAETPLRGMIIGCLMASFSAMQFLFAPLWGRISDRIGRRPVLLIGLAGSTVFYGAFGLVTQWGNSGPILGLSPLTWLFITRIGAGISGATISTAQAYIADSTDASSRGKGMAIIGAAFGVGFTFGPILGSLCVSSDPNAPPSPMPGYEAAALSLLAFLFGLSSLPESLKRGDSIQATSHGRMKLGAMFRVVMHRSLGPIILAIFLTTFAFAQFETTLAKLTQAFGVSDQKNFYIFSYIGLILTISQGVLVRRLIPRLGEFKMAIAGVVLMTIGLLLIGMTALQSSYWLLIAVLPVVVIGFSSTTPALQSMLSLNSGSEEQGEILGVGQGVSALARIAGPVVGLSLQDRDLALPYWSASLLMAISVVMVFRLKSIIKLRDLTVT